MGYGDKKEDTITRANIYDKDNSRFDITVLDDAALGFRFSTNQNAWPRSIREGKTDELGLVVLKMSSPVAQGDLWRTLSDRFREKLVVIASVEDIRREEAGITGGLSWERAAQELLSELLNNTCIRDLINCRHLIVNFGSEGAVWVNNTKGRHEPYLIYDPAHLEGEWEEKIKGRSLGYMSCLTAGVVNQLAGPSREIDIAKGIMAGLSAMRQLHFEGHGSLDGVPGFPFDKIAEKIMSPSSGYCAVQVLFPEKGAKHQAYFWTIAEGNRGGGKEVSAPLYGLARRVALFGTRALSNIPYAQFGKLFTIDRSEVESFRGIQRLIKDYAANPRPPRPLSIAVFGPPRLGQVIWNKTNCKDGTGEGCASP